MWVIISMQSDRVRIKSDLDYLPGLTGFKAVEIIGNVINRKKVVLPRKVGSPRSIVFLKSSKTLFLLACFACIHQNLFESHCTCQYCRLLTSGLPKV